MTKSKRFGKEILFQMEHTLTPTKANKQMKRPHISHTTATTINVHTHRPIPVTCLCDIFYLLHSFCFSNEIHALFFIIFRYVLCDHNDTFMTDIVLQIHVKSSSFRRNWPIKINRHLSKQLWNWLIHVTFNAYTWLQFNWLIGCNLFDYHLSTFNSVTLYFDKCLFLHSSLSMLQTFKLYRF